MSKALEELLARATELEAAVGDDEPKGYDFDSLPEALEDVEVKAWAACPECGSTDTDEYADGTARCEDCGTALTESKAAAGFDFEDVDLDEKGDPYVRDGIGRFAEEGDKGKGKKPAGEDDEEEELPEVEDLDDVRRIIRAWDEVPAAQRAALKRRLLAVVKRESTEEHPHERLIALIGGLGDGDGKREAGEGAGRALSGKPGAAREWLRERGLGELTTRGKKDDLDGLELKELLERRSALG